MQIPLMEWNLWKAVRVAALGLAFGGVFSAGSARAWAQISQSGMGGSSGGIQGADVTQGFPTPGKTQKTGSQNPDMPAEPINARMEEQQAKLRNSDRQKRLQSDSEKLLALATQLKEQVDKTNKDILSVDVIKKADEIEKLARSVKDRMKG